MAIDDEESFGFGEACDGLAEDAGESAQPAAPLRDRCVLGADCCCPHLNHGPDECFTAEMMEAWERGDLGAGDA